MVSWNSLENSTAFYSSTGHRRMDQRSGELHTCDQVSEANCCQGDEGEVEAIDIGPSLFNHEHKWGDQQMHQNPPQEEEGCACELSFTLKADIERLLTSLLAKYPAILHFQLTQKPQSAMDSAQIKTRCQAKRLFTSSLLKAYQSQAPLGQVLAQVLGSAPKELAQFTDPGQAERDAEEPIEDAEDTST